MQLWRQLANVEALKSGGTFYYAENAAEIALLKQQRSHAQEEHAAKMRHRCVNYKKKESEFLFQSLRLREIMMTYQE